MARTRALFRLEGTEQLARNLKEAERRVLTKGLRAALTRAGEPVRDEAERRAPRRSGKLARNIMLEWQGRRRRVAVGPHKDAYYGEFQERGTSRHPAQPFLRPALDSKKEEAFEIMARELGKALG